MNDIARRYTAKLSILQIVNFVAVAVLLMAAASCALYLLGWGRIPPGARTLGGINRVQSALNAFGRQFGRPPGSLLELEESGFLLLQSNDEWGRPLIYSVDGSGLVELGSLGADGKPGGSGDDADLLRQFLTWDAAGGFVPHVYVSESLHEH